MKNCPNCNNIVRDEYDTCPFCKIEFAKYKAKQKTEPSNPPPITARETPAIPKAKKKFQAAIPVIALIVLAVIGVSGYFFLRAPLARKSAENTLAKYKDAISKQDISLLEAVLSEDAKKEMIQPGAPKELVMTLINRMTPSEMDIKKYQYSGDKIVFTVKGKDANLGPSTGTFDFKKESGGWKIAKVSWEMQMNSAGSIYDPDYEIKLSGFLNGAVSLPKIDPELLKAGNELFASIPATALFIKDKKYFPKPIKTVQAEGSHLEFTSDGKFLVCAGYGDYMLKVFDTAAWKTVFEQKLDNRPSGLCVLPSAGRIVVPDAKGSISFYDFNPAAILETDLNNVVEFAGSFDLDMGPQPVIAVSPNSKLMASVSYEGFLALWDISTAEKKCIGKIKLPFPLRSIAFSPAGPVLAAGSATNKYILWDLRTTKGKVYTVPKVSKTSDISSLSFSPDGSRLVTTHMDTSITVWDVKAQNEIFDFFIEDASAMCSVFSPDGKIFATGHSNNGVYIWNSQNAMLSSILKGHTGIIKSLSFNPEGSMLASGGEDNTVIIWQ